MIGMSMGMGMIPWRWCGMLVCLNARLVGENLTMEEG